jgi:hypothetical protein
MIESSSLPDSHLQFFRSLFIKTSGNIRVQVSMHEIGNEAGMDKSTSKTVAEDLMSVGLIDIRTLSGGIGLTEEGFHEAQNQFADIVGSGGSGIKLGNHPVIGEKVGVAIMDILSDLKPRIGKLGMAYDDLTELLADIQTLEAQMRSSKPKTAIVRECLRSMQPLLTSANDTETLFRINYFLAD